MRELESLSLVGDHSSSDAGTIAFEELRLQTVNVARKAKKKLAAFFTDLFACP